MEALLIGVAKQYGPNVMILVMLVIMVMWLRGQFALMSLGISNLHTNLKEDIDELKESREQSMGSHYARMADAGYATETWQFWSGTSGCVSLGIRLRSTGCRERLYSAERFAFGFEKIVRAVSRAYARHSGTRGQ